MDSVWGFIGIMVFICGIYAVYAFVKMKATGEVSETLLLGKEYRYKKCKDKEAYIRKAGPALLIFGIKAVIYGGIDIVHCYIYPMAVVDMVGMVVFLCVLIWFGIYTTKVKNEYY